MRFILQIMAMLSDVMIFTACGILIYNIPQMGFIGMLFLLYILNQTLKTWKEQGDFIAWKPYWIKKFMKHAKEMNL